MKSTCFWALIVLNTALLLSFVWRLTPSNMAVAQQRGGVARTGDYLVLPADVTGSSNGVVVVLDQGSGMLTGLSYDEGSKGFGTPMAKIDLHQVFQGPVGGRGPRGAAR